MSALVLSSQFVREFSALEAELERLRAARASEPADDALTIERDDLKRQRDELRAALDQASKSHHDEIARLTAEAAALAGALALERQRVQDLARRLAEAQRQNDAECADLRARLARVDAELATKLEQLVLAEYDRDTERERASKLAQENNELRDELHRCERLLAGRTTEAPRRDSR